MFIGIGIGIALGWAKPYGSAPGRGIVDDVIDGGNVASSFTNILIDGGTAAVSQNDLIDGGLV